MAMVLVLVVAGAAIAQTTVTTGPTVDIGELPYDWTPDTLYFGVRFVRCTMRDGSEVDLVDLAQELRTARDRIASLEAQVRFLAWERRKAALIDEFVADREREGSEAYVVFGPRWDEMSKALGPCPPWPWSAPATKEATR
jgi:hypothetical protein